MHDDGVYADGLERRDVLKYRLDDLGIIHRVAAVFYHDVFVRIRADIGERFDEDLRFLDYLFVSVFHLSSGRQRWKPTSGSPSVSGMPNMMFMFWIACPLAPLMRLSMQLTTISLFVFASDVIPI